MIIFDLDDTILPTTDQLFSLGEYGLSDLDHITTYKGSEETLEFCNSLTNSFLVTKGDPTLQNEKIAKLKIKSYFKEIIIVPTNEDKYFAFKHLIDKYNKRAGEAVVVGDKIKSEILYGNILGTKTIQLIQGRHSKNYYPQYELEIPTYSIYDIREIINIICAEFLDTQEIKKLKTS